MVFWGSKIKEDIKIAPWLLTPDGPKQVLANYCHSIPDDHRKIAERYFHEELAKWLSSEPSRGVKRMAHAMFNDYFEAFHMRMQALDNKPSETGRMSLFGELLVAHVTAGVVDNLCDKRGFSNEDCVQFVGRVIGATLKSLRRMKENGIDFSGVHVEPAIRLTEVSSGLNYVADYEPDELIQMIRDQPKVTATQIMQSYPHVVDALSRSNNLGLQPNPRTI